MTWHSPLSPTIMALLVLLSLAMMAGSYLFSHRQLNVSSRQAVATVLLRGLGFLLLLFFVFGPSRLPRPRTIMTQRTLAVLIDSSGSMSRLSSAEIGAGTRIDEVRRLIRTHRIMEQITGQAKLALYGFDEGLVRLKTDGLAGLKAAGRATDLPAAIQQAVHFHETDDLAGLLLFTDGRNTQMDDPRKTAKELGVPLFLMAVGAEPTEQKQQAEDIHRDLAVLSASANPRIILGHTAQVVASVEAKAYPARQLAVQLLSNERVISSTAVALSPQHNRRQALFSVKPTSVGLHRYQILIPPEDDETDTTNNSVSLEIEVVDIANRLLYIDRLRPERRFLKRVLESQRNLQLTAIVQQSGDRLLIQGNDPQAKAQAASLEPQQMARWKTVVIGDLPAAAISPQQIVALVQWVDKGGALLLLAGPESMGPGGLAGTPLSDLLPIKPLKDLEYIEGEFRVELTSEGAAHPAFQRVRSRWLDAPSLLSRLNVAGVKPAATVLMATADTQHLPIAVSHHYGRGKVAVMLTDTTWRWQLGFDPSGGSSSDASHHQVFWDQMIDWLGPELKEEQAEAGQVQLISDRLEYELNDEVILVVSVHGADGTMLEDASVEVTVATPDGRPIKRTATLEQAGDEVSSPAFSASFQAYAVGEYAIQTTAKRAGKSIGSDSVRVRVHQPSVEFARTDPDRQLLAEMAKASGGKYLQPADLDRLAAVTHLAAREVLVQPNADADAEPIWNRWWLATAFIALMSGEWFIRRKNRWV